MIAPLLLDTHTLLWVLREPCKLSENVKSIIWASQQVNGLMISSITLWEVAMLASRKRIDVNTHESVGLLVESMANVPGLSIIDISPKIATLSNMLPGDFHGDPADRIITATAICNKATLVTKDCKILAWSKLNNVATIEP